MKIRDAVLSDIPSVVSVHKQAFPDFFLTLLGNLFLAELYKSYIVKDLGLLRVLCDETDSVIGFAAGCVNPDIFYAQLKRERGGYFLLKIIPGMFMNPLLVIKKLWYALFYKGEKPAQVTNALLLSSIGVIPGQSGNSYGKNLLSDFERKGKERMVDIIFLTTDKYGNDKVVSFYKKSGYKIDSEITQAAGRVMLRFTKSLVEK